MGKRIKVVNLNKYVKTTDEENADLVIIPFKVNGKIVNQKMFFKRKNVPNEIVDIDDAVWTMQSKLSVAGTVEEYAERVHWWFDSIDEEYEKILNCGWGNVIPNLADEVDKIRKYLVESTPSRREKNIHRYITNRLNHIAGKLMGRK